MITLSNTQVVSQCEATIPAHEARIAELEAEEAALIEKHALGPNALGGSPEHASVTSSLTLQRAVLARVIATRDKARAAVEEERRAAHAGKANELATSIAGPSQRAGVEPHARDFLGHVLRACDSLTAIEAVRDRHSRIAAQAEEHASAAGIDLAIPRIDPGFALAVVLTQFSRGEGLPRRDLASWLGAIASERQLAIEVARLCGQEGTVRDDAPYEAQIEACLNGESIRDLPASPPAPRTRKPLGLAIAEEVADIRRIFSSKDDHDELEPTTAA